MSRNTKIILGIVGGLAIVCLCFAGVAALGLGSLVRNVQNSSVTDPAEVQKVAAQIADFTIPEGYTTQSLSVLGVTMVFLMPDDEQTPFIMLMQFPASMQVDREQAQRQLDDAMERQLGQGNREWTDVGSEPVTIRGQEVMLQVRDGQDENGQRIRQGTALFEGKNGTAMVTLIGPEARWDQDAVETFLATLK